MDATSSSGQQMRKRARGTVGFELRDDVGMDEAEGSAAATESSVNVGPKNVDDVVGWGAAMASRMNDVLCEHSTSWSVVCEPYGAGGNFMIVLTSHFSGIGSAEVAWKQIHDTLAQVFGCDFQCMVWAATDKNDKCAAVPQCHESPSHLKPAHVFGDILDLMPACRRRQLEAAQKQQRENFKTACGDRSGADRRGILAEHCEKFLEVATNI